MATFCSHAHTLGYILLSSLISEPDFIRTATLKATFKTHGYTHGYILHSWLHFTLMATRRAKFSAHSYLHGSVLHSCLRPLMATFYTHGYTQPWLHLALMVAGTLTFACIDACRYSYSIPVT